MPTLQFPLSITLLFVRPNTTIPWFHDSWPPSHMEYVNSTYKSGKFEGRYAGHREDSVDGLTVRMTYTYNDEEIYKAFAEDPYLSEMRNARDLYNQEHDIFLV